MVSQVINLALRGLQFLWTLLTTALVGSIIASAFSGNPSIINYDMFVCVFSWLSLFYLIPVTLKPNFSFHPIIMLALDFLNMLFFFIAGVAMAAELGVHSCGNQAYIHTNKITNGADNQKKRCHEAQASTAFLWFGFAAYAMSTVFSALQSKGTNINMRGIRGSGPAMSQV